MILEKAWLQSGISAFWKMTPATRTAFSASKKLTRIIVAELQQMDNVRSSLNKGTGVSQDDETADAVLLKRLRAWGTMR